jgi:hypothetical protein
MKHARAVRGLKNKVRRIVHIRKSKNLGSRIFLKKI